MSQVARPLVKGGLFFFFFFGGGGGSVGRGGGVGGVLGFRVWEGRRGGGGGRAKKGPKNWSPLMNTLCTDCLLN